MPSVPNMIGVDIKSIDGLPFCAFMSDSKGVIDWVNTAGFSFFVSEQVVGRSVSDVFTGISSLRSAIDTVLSTLNPLTLTKVEVCILGVGIKVVDMSISLFCDKVLCCVTKDYDGDGDVHNGVSKIVSLLAHEIKNPLSGILGASQLLVQSLSDLKQDTSLASLIEEETNRITRLVNKLEDLAIDKPIDFKAVNIHQLLDKAVSLGQASWAGKCGIKKQYDPSLPHAWGQDDILMQVLINLIKNSSESFDYKEKKEFNILIKTSFLSGVGIVIDGVKHQAFCVDITDNGCGIDMDKQVDIFAPYVSLKKGGSGLGLSIVSRYVNAHKGRVRLKSDHTGTTFSIILPLEVL